MLAMIANGVAFSCLAYLYGYNRGWEASETETEHRERTMKKISSIIRKGDKTVD